MLLDKGNKKGGDIIRPAKTTLVVDSLAMTAISTGDFYPDAA